MAIASNVYCDVRYGVDVNIVRYVEGGCHYLENTKTYERKKRLERYDPLHSQLLL
jgi:hypothetical protein